MDIKKYVAPTVMWIRPENAVVIHPSQLAVGLYVWLDIPWDAHPFLYNKFRISSAEQIAEIRGLNLESVKFFPNKSTAEPAELAKPTENTNEVAAIESTPSAAEQAVCDSAEIERLTEEKRAKLQRHKDATARAQRGWERAAKATREALLGMSRSPKQAGEQVAVQARAAVNAIASGDEVLLHLLRDLKGDGAHYHAINVMTLSLLLGKTVKLDEKAMLDLAMAAVVHDAGKARIPSRLLMTHADSRAKHEEEFYRQHSTYSVELAREAGVFGIDALLAIADHHEYLDGSGWPRKKKNVGTLAQIIGMVDRYDRLCSPEAPDRKGLMPREALAILFSKDASRFDPQLVGALVRLLGVFPPGTIVQLNDGSLGLVVSPGAESLRPSVVIYTPEAPRDEGPVIDLAEEPDLSIEEALRPESLPEDVLAWLSPGQRMSYYFSTETSS